MKIRIWGFLRRLLGDPRLTVRYGDDAWITLNEQDYLQREILIHGAYEPEVWESLSQHANGSDVVWDIGANIGSVAIRASRDPRVAEVHAFEPDPLTRRVLCINNRVNGTAFQVHGIGLSDQIGPVKIYHGPGTNTGMSTLVAGALDNAQDLWADCSTVDHLVFVQKMRPPTLVKLDVEGWEPFVLRGAQRVLAEAPPRAIVFESEQDAEMRPCGTDVSDLLTHAGYTISHISRLADTPKLRENFLAYRASSREPTR